MVDFGFNSFNSNHENYGETTLVCETKVSIDVVLQKPVNDRKSRAQYQIELPV